MRRDREERGEKKKILVRLLDRLPQPAERLSLAVPCDGTGRSSCQMAMTPPAKGSRQQVPRSLLLPRHGGRQQTLVSWQTAPTPSIPLG